MEEGPEPTLLSVEAPVIQCLQYHAEDVLPVCGSQCYFLCCCVLGQQSEGSKLLRKAGSALRVELDSLMVVLERKMLHKLQSIMDHGSHPH